MTIVLLRMSVLCLLILIDLHVVSSYEYDLDYSAYPEYPNSDNSSSSDYPSCTKQAELTPQEPIIARNQTMVLNCTLLANFTIGARGIYWMIGDESISSDYVDTVNDVTSVLKYQKPKIRWHGLIVYCLHDEAYECSYDYGNYGEKWVETTVLLIGDYPEKPHGVECRVHDGNYMRCQWNPANQYDNNIATKQTLFWKNSEDTIEQECVSKVTDNICDFPQHKFEHGAVYWVRVEASNKLANVSSDVFAINTTIMVTSGGSQGESRLPSQLSTWVKCVTVVAIGIFFSNY